MLGLALVALGRAALALLLLLGISFSLFTSSANALVQLALPTHLRGRVMASTSSPSPGSRPIGGLVAGWLAEQGGTALAFGLAGVAGLAHDRLGVSRSSAILGRLCGRSLGRVGRRGIASRAVRLRFLFGIART